MKRPIRIKIEKELSKNILTEYSTSFEIDNTIKVSEIKKEIKKTIPTQSEIVKETLFLKDKELKDDEVVNGDGNLIYKLQIK